MKVGVVKRETIIELLLKYSKCRWTCINMYSTTIHTSIRIYYWCVHFFCFIFLAYSSLRILRNIFPLADCGSLFLNSTPPANRLNGATASEKNEDIYVNEKRITKSSLSL